MGDCNAYPPFPFWARQRRADQDMKPILECEVSL